MNLLNVEMVPSLVLDCCFLWEVSTSPPLFYCGYESETCYRGDGGELWYSCSVRESVKSGDGLSCFLFSSYDRDG